VQNKAKQIYPGSVAYSLLMALGQEINDKCHAHQNVSLQLYNSVTHQSSLLLFYFTVFTIVKRFHLARICWANSFLCCSNPYKHTSTQIVYTPVL